MPMKKSHMTSETIAMSFIRMLSAGPEVSLSGSPTVSPTTAALWHSPPLRWTTPPTSRQPFSTYFLALSQAPPVLLADMASCTPLSSPPARRPATLCTPNSVPVTIGDRMTSRPGATISRRLASVEILMQRAWSGGPWPGVPSRRPGMVSNWRLTSLTISIAASPTDFIVSAENQYGSMLPTRSDAKTVGASMLTPPLSTPVRVTKAAVSASDTSAAEPIANPLPMAAVVLPAASSASVLSRTLSGSSDISAMPPALSQTGPYTSIERHVGRVPSMPSAARATPYMLK
mmetsp:Transcript_3243/g.10111  ORF Transcript_3243/g.10111 Transcript_3243/m.10111 type:complete len:288 (-) Transcript_3243:1611-2474(-)